MGYIKKRKLLTGIIGLTLIICGMTFFYASANNETEEQEEEELKQKREEIEEIYTDDYQNKVEERLEYAKSTGDYTEEAMLIEPNPYGTNTLSLYVYFKTEEAASVSYNISVPDDSIADFEATPDGEEEYKTEHEFQVIGLVPDEKNTVTFTIKNESGEENTYTYKYNMGNLIGEEETVLETTVGEANAEELSNGLYAILGNDSDGLDFMYYYDNSGVIRGEIPLIGYRSHRLLFQEGLMYYSISQTKIAAVNALGKAEQIFDTGKYELHHDYVFDDDGNILVLATDTESDTVEDQIVKIDTKTGEVTCVLDLGDLLPDYKEQCTENVKGTEDENEMDWMHINTIQWLGEQTVVLSSRETSSILEITNLYSNPELSYIIGEESFWKDTGYEDLLLKKDESGGSFSGTGGQHTVTYEPDDTLEDGTYYLYMFNNNMGVSDTRPDYDWTQIAGIEDSITDGNTSYFYQYLVDENTGTYSLVQSFQVPFSAYVSSVQKLEGNIIIDSGMKGLFGEYDSNGNLLRQFKMELADEYIYRVYKYDFEDFYFSELS